MAGSRNPNTNSLHRGYDMSLFQKHGLFRPFDQRKFLKPGESGFCLGFASAVLKNAKNGKSDISVTPIDEMKRFQAAAHRNPVDVDPIESAHAVAGIDTLTTTRLVPVKGIDTELKKAKTAVIEADLRGGVNPHVGRGFHAYAFTQIEGNTPLKKCIAAEANRGTWEGSCKLARNVLQEWIKTDAGEEGHVRAVVVKKKTCKP